MFKGEQTVSGMRRYTHLNGKRALYAVADTQSMPFVRQSFNYELHDVIHVWFDPDTLLPILITKDIHEGNWRNNVRIEIDQENKQAVYFDKREKEGVVMELAHPTFDILTMVYYVRARATVGQPNMNINYLIDNKKGIDTAVMRIVKGEDLSVGSRRVKTLMFEQLGGPEVRVRMTDDANRIPVSITVGTFEVHGYRIDIVGNLIQINRP